MDEENQELMNRYIYEVTRRISRKQQDEVSMELKELIEDMMEAEDANVAAVLETLGNPVKLAEKYKDTQPYLIGGEYFDHYMWVLKVVLACVAGSMFLALIVKSLIENGDVLANFGIGIMEGLIGLVTAFGAVTGIFAVLERRHIKIQVVQPKIWTPAQLTPIPQKKGRISRGDTVVEIVFATLFAGLLVFVPNLLGIWMTEGGRTTVVPVFNMEHWNVILIFMLTALMFCLVDAVIRLVSGRYSRIVMVSCILSGVIQMILAVIILKVLPLWNEAFFETADSRFHTEISQNGFLMEVGFAGLSNVILAIIIFATLLEIANTVYKTLRYGDK